MKAAAVLLFLLVSAATLTGMGSASLGSRSTSQAPRPIATVVQHGGLCFRGRERPGTECRSTVTITDRWISAPGARRRALTKAERAQLLNAIGQIRAEYLRQHPFRGQCPTSLDGLESVYRFRGFATPLASCIYDLSGVRAVTLVNRLIVQLAVGPCPETKGVTLARCRESALD